MRLSGDRHRRLEPVRTGVGRAAVVSGVGFLALAVLVTTEWSQLLAVDQKWSARAYAFTLTHPSSEKVWRVVTDTASPLTVTLVTTAVVISLAFARRWWLAVWLAVTVAGGGLLNTLVKAAIERVRPPSTGELTAAHGFSFPSGHTESATVTYVAVVLVVGWSLWRPLAPVRRATAMAVTALVGAVGLSRVFLGVHWPSDVLGGWLLGTAWVTGATAILLAAMPRPRSVEDR